MLRHWRHLVVIFSTLLAGCSFCDNAEWDYEANYDSAFYDLVMEWVSEDIADGANCTSESIRNYEGTVIGQHYYCTQCK